MSGHFHCFQTSQNASKVPIPSRINTLSCFLQGKNENTIEEKDSNFDFATENNNCVKVLTDKLLLGIFTKCIGNCLYF